MPFSTQLKGALSWVAYNGASTAAGAAAGFVSQHPETATKFFEYTGRTLVKIPVIAGAASFCGAIAAAHQLFNLVAFKGPKLTTKTAGFEDYINESYFKMATWNVVVLSGVTYAAFAASPTVAPLFGLAALTGQQAFIAGIITATGQAVFALAADGVNWVLTHRADQYTKAQTAYTTAKKAVDDKQKELDTVLKPAVKTAETDAANAATRLKQYNAYHTAANAKQTKATELSAIKIDPKFADNVRTAKEALDKAEKDKKTLEQQLTPAKESVTQLNTKAKAHQDVITEYNNANKSLETAEAAYQKAVKDQELANQAFKTAIQVVADSAEPKPEHLLKALEQATKSLETAEAATKTAEESVIPFKTAVDKLLQGKTDAEDQLKALQIQLTTASDTITKLESQIAALKVDEKKQAHATAEKDSQQHQDQVKQRKETLNNEIAAQQTILQSVLNFFQDPQNHINGSAFDVNAADAKQTLVSLIATADQAVINAKKAVSDAETALATDGKLKTSLKNAQAAFVKLGGAVA